MGLSFEDACRGIAEASSESWLSDFTGTASPPRCGFHGHLAGGDVGPKAIHEGPLRALNPVEIDLAQSLERHVRGVASEPHNFAHPAALERSALYIENSLAGLGYQVRRQRSKADGRRFCTPAAMTSPVCRRKRASRYSAT